MMSYPKIVLVLFLCAASSLAYELTLTRIFSIALWYHFAFMIISIAMLGIGASGTALFIFPKLRNVSHMGAYAFFLGMTILLSYLTANRIPFDPVQLSWSKTQIAYIGMYYIALSIPFFFAGLIIASALSSVSERSGLLYGSDLLGAGTGTLSVLLLMTAVSPEKVVLIISSMALSAALVASGKRLRIVSIVLLMFNLSLFVLSPSWLGIRMSPYKGLQIAMMFPGAEHFRIYNSPYSRIDTFTSPAVRFAPGISLRYLERLPEQIGFSIDGGEINAVTHDNGSTSAAFLSYLPSALAYEIGRKDGVVILDPKGGLQALMAKHYRSSKVYSIESNPLIIRLINSDFREFSGGIYSHNSWPGLGRSWLHNHDMKFDIIDIPLTGIIPSGSFGISEDYRFTVEAFKVYLSHLKEEGLLSIHLFIVPPPRMELRILNTAVKAMEEQGVRDAAQRIIAIRSWGSVCILIKKSPFTFSEIVAVRTFAGEKRFDTVHYPGIKEEETNRYVHMPSNEYFVAFKSILDPDTRKGFNDAYAFDIKPVRDENPFFHYYFKFENIRQIYKTMGSKWQYFIEEGYFLPVVFVQVLVLSLLFFLLPLAVMRKEKGPDEGKKKPGIQLLPYFLLLGAGFMFVEVPLVQKTILPLENPPYAFATVLTSLLISSGAGSLLSYHVSSLRKPVISLIISLLVLLYSLLLPHVFDFIYPHRLTLRILMISLILSPLGFFMGIPFPTGLKILGRNNPSLIPWAWSINACLSVLAPIMTIMIALVLGFRSVLWLGALAYLLAFVMLKVFLQLGTNEDNPSLSDPGTMAGQIK